MATLTQCDCGHIAKAEGCSLGYGIFDNKKLCFDCCALEDLKILRNEDHWTGYFSAGILSNWPGTLKLYPVFRVGRNKSHPRTDFWFTFEGQRWHGFQAGHYNELAHCKRLKGSK